SLPPTLSSSGRPEPGSVLSRGQHRRDGESPLERFVRAAEGGILWADLFLDSRLPEDFLPHLEPRAERAHGPSLGPGLRKQSRLAGRKRLVLDQLDQASALPRGRRPPVALGTLWFAASISLKPERQASLPQHTVQLDNRP